MKICGVYRIFNKITGYSYFGSSIDCVRRLKSHRSALRTNKHGNPYLCHSWQKNGETNFEISVIEECSQEIRVAREQWYIDSTEKVYNVARKATPGPTYPRTTWTDERKKKHSKFMQGNKHLKGVKFSEEARKNMRNARKGKKHNYSPLAKIKLGARMSKLCKETNKDKPQNQKGYVQSPEARRNHKKAMDKMEFSEERRKAIGVRTAERNRKNSKKNNPDWWTPERIQCRIEIGKRTKHTPERKLAQKKLMKNLWEKEDFRKAVDKGREKTNAAKRTPEGREKLSIRVTKQWADPDMRNKMCTSMKGKKRKKKNGNI